MDWGGEKTGSTLDMGKRGVKITINDIAKLANVSKSTISRVINNSGPVSEETKRAVVDAMNTLDYHPNEIARSLSLKRTHTIGVIVQDIRNPYYANASWYAERYFRDFNYNSIICNADNDPTVEESFLRAMKFRNVDGILLVGVQEEAGRLLSFNTSNDIPLVMVDREISGSEIFSVVLDNVYGGQLVVDYLFSSGHRRIAFVTSGFTQAERDRLEGYIAAHRNRNMQIDPSFIITQSEEMWHRGECPELMKLLRRKDRPTALFASNDYKALQMLKLLRRSSIDVPEEVSIVGYDDIESSSIIYPSLTTVHQPIDKMIDQGARMLLDIVRGGQPEDRKVIMRPWLVERESTSHI
ncbi:MAG: LacI family transcriptional regulator [Spirochaetales bacterium]|nr:LacI family transcriptional regulator [Spirochaetales bacterium]MCF7937965.1 LacI family transcriptional regulator [Spirochaetales bacterium]